MQAHGPHTTVTNAKQSVIRNK